MKTSTTILRTGWLVVTCTLFSVSTPMVSADDDIRKDRHVVPPLLEYRRVADEVVTEANSLIDEQSGVRKALQGLLDDTKDVEEVLDDTFELEEQLEATQEGLQAMLEELQSIYRKAIKETIDKYRDINTRYSSTVATLQQKEQAIDTIGASFVTHVMAGGDEIDAELAEVIMLIDELVDSTVAIGTDLPSTDGFSIEGAQNFLHSLQQNISILSVRITYNEALRNALGAVREHHWTAAMNADLLAQGRGEVLKPEDIRALRDRLDSDKAARSGSRVDTRSLFNDGKR